MPEDTTPRQQVVKLIQQAYEIAENHALPEARFIDDCANQMDALYREENHEET